MIKSHFSLFKQLQINKFEYPDSTFNSILTLICIYGFNFENYFLINFKYKCLMFPM